MHELFRQRMVRDCCTIITVIYSSLCQCQVKLLACTMFPLLTSLQSPWKPFKQTLPVSHRRPQPIFQHCGTKEHADIIANRIIPQDFDV